MDRDSGRDRQAAPARRTDREARREAGEGGEARLHREGLLSAQPRGHRLSGEVARGVAYLRAKGYRSAEIPLSRRVSPPGQSPGRRRTVIMLFFLLSLHGWIPLI